MTYGNLAYKYDYEEERSVREKTKVKHGKVNKRKNAKKKNDLSYFGKILSVLTLTAAAIYMIIQFVEVNETQSDLKAAMDQYSFEQSVTAQKAYELEQSIDLSKIEQEATTRLGMRRPEKHQIIYIDVKQDDTTEKTADEVEGVSNRFMSGLKSIISNIVDFFSI